MIGFDEMFDFTPEELEEMSELYKTLTESDEEEDS